VFILIALACDHGGFELMQQVKAHLDENGFEYKDFGTFSEESCDYPEYAIAASQSIKNGECDLGILICGTGIGMAITANKVPGIRAATCTDTYSAQMSRQHNNANVLTLGARVTGLGLALMIVDRFLGTEFEGGRHARRVDMIIALESD